MPRGKLVILVVAVLAALIGGSAAAVVFRVQAAPDAAAAHGSPSSEPAPPGPMHVLKERVVNLADPGGRRYIKIGMSLEFGTRGSEPRKASAEERKVKQEEFDKEIAQWVPLIDDTVIMLISARTSADLGTAEGKQALKNDVKETLNRLLGQEQVVNVYYNQFVMQ